jgi:hypothetical protein
VKWLSHARWGYRPFYLQRMARQSCDTFRTVAAPNNKSRTQILAGIVLLLTGGATCRGIDISVRVINGENGAPMDKQLIWLFLGRDASAPLLKGTTGADGRVLFHLPDPPSERVFAFDAGNTRGGCSDINFITNEVLQYGVVRTNNCDRKHKIREQVAARPGEAVIFHRHVHWWEFID